MAADIVWLVEHVDRELDAACIAKVLLAERHGIQVDVLHMYLDIEAAARRRDAAVVVLPYFYQRIPQFHDAFLSHQLAHATIFSMAWEQIYYKSQEAIKAPRDDFARNHVYYLAWGDFFRDYLAGHGGATEHVSVIGHPALQLYSEPYRRIFPTREQIAARFGLDVTKRWVVIPENYRWAFRSKTSTIKAGKGSVDVEKLLEMRQFCIDSLKMLTTWCQAAAGAGNLEIILRPRPSTSVSRMESFISNTVSKQHPNFRIIKDLSAREWILAADLVVSSVSTTLIEAAIAGKRTAIAEPLPIIDQLAAEWQGLVPHLATQEAFIATCNGDVSPVHDRRLEAWAQSQYLRFGDVYDGLTSRLANLVRERRRIVPRHRNGDELLVAPALPQRLFWQLLGYLRQSPHYQPIREKIRHLRARVSGRSFAPIPYVATNHDKDLFTPNDVATRVAAWRATLAGRRSEQPETVGQYDPAAALG